MLLGQVANRAKWAMKYEKGWWIYFMRTMFCFIVLQLDGELRGEGK
jgi:hypothetical protein